VAAAKKSQDMPFGAAALFTAVGAGILALVLGTLVGPAAWVRFAYRPAVATVVDRRLSTETPKSGTSHRLEVLLEYRVDDRDYRGWVTLPRSTREASGPEADAVLGQLALGQHVACYHDPLDPAAGVALERDRLEWSMLYGLLCPGLFLAVGVAGLVTSWRKTFPRGVAVDTLDLLRRLPRRFYASGAGALLVAGAVLWTLRTYGSALGGWVCPVLLAGGGLVFWLARSALGYGSVVLPSPEKRAAAEQQAASPPPAAASAPAVLDPNRAEGVAVARGRRLPVRLKPDWSDGRAGGGCLLTFWVLAFLVIMLTVLTVRAAKGEGPPGVLLWPAGLGLFLIAAAAVALGRSFLRRVGGLAVELSAHPLRAGGSYRVAVHHPEPGAPGPVRLALVCEEEATTVGGKGSSTTRHTASRKPVLLAEPHGPEDVREGRLDVPAAAPPSFRLTNHRVTWYLEVVLGRWLPWTTRCEVTVEAVGPAEEPAAAARLEDDRVSLWVDGSRSVFRPGDVVAGGCAVHAGDAGPLRTAELSVLWYTEPPGTAELGVCHYEEHAAVEGDDAPLYGRRPFRVRLPAGPPSHDGRAVKVRWAVRLRLRYVSGEEVVREVPFRFGAAPGPASVGSRAP
jgi:hypothetical protein